MSDQPTPEDEGVDADDVERANEAAEEQFERTEDEIEEQVDSITEMVNEELDAKRAERGQA